MSSRPDSRRGGPDPNHWVGALFYSIIGGLTVALILAVLHHIHVVWS